MTPHDLYLEARRLGLRLEPRGDKLAVTPKGVCPPDFAARLREHKAELLEWLNSPPCPGWLAIPPADLPLVPYEPRPSPAGRQLVLDYLTRQTGDEPGPLSAWLVRRESDYYDGCGRNWRHDIIAYAGARDAACWQHNCNEAQLLEKLEGFEEASNHNWPSGKPVSHLAKQIIANEFTGADANMITNLFTILRNLTDPTAKQALRKLAAEPNCPDSLRKSIHGSEPTV